MRAVALNRHALRFVTFLYDCVSQLALLRQQSQRPLCKSACLVSLAIKEACSDLQRNTTTLAVLHKVSETKPRTKFSQRMSGNTTTILPLLLFNFYYDVVVFFFLIDPSEFKL